VERTTTTTTSNMAAPDLRGRVRSTQCDDLGRTRRASPAFRRAPVYS
jgi:hypothetical protein